MTIAMVTLYIDHASHSWELDSDYDQVFIKTGEMLLQECFRLCVALGRSFIWYRIRIDILGGTACKMPLFLENQNNYSFVRHSEAISVGLGLELYILPNTSPSVGFCGASPHFLCFGTEFYQCPRKLLKSSPAPGDGK